MAKRNKEAQARTAKANAQKAAKAANVKAHIGQRTAVAAKEAADAAKDNVVKLNAGPATPIIKPENAFDLSIHLSAEVDPRTADNKPHLRTIIPTDDQVNTVAALADSSLEDFGKSLKAFQNTIAEAQWKAHIFCVALAVRVQRDGEEAVKLVQKFLDSVAGVAPRFTMIRLPAVEAWLLAKLPIEYDEDRKEYRLDKKRHRSEGGKFGTNRTAWIKERATQPFFMFKPAAPLQEFHFLESIAAQIAKAKRIAGMDKTVRDQKYKTVELEGLEVLERAMKALENKADDAEKDKAA